ncbi:hypothetical protein OROGR_020808 [Orobanche gracilis]
MHLKLSKLLKHLEILLFGVDFNLVKAHCKHCGKFLKHESNSTLKTHTDKYCDGLKSIPEAGQASMSREVTSTGKQVLGSVPSTTSWLALKLPPASPFDNFLKAARG